MFDVTLSLDTEEKMFLVTMRAARLDEEPDVRYQRFFYEPGNAKQTYLKAQAATEAAYEALRMTRMNVGSNLGSTLMMGLEAKRMDDAVADLQDRMTLGEMLGTDGAGRG